MVEANKNKLENKLWLFVGYKLILMEQEAKSDAGKNIKTTRAFVVTKCIVTIENCAVGCSDISMMMMMTVCVYPDLCKDLDF